MKAKPKVAATLAKEPGWLKRLEDIHLDILVTDVATERVLASADQYLKDAADRREQRDIARIYERW